MKKNCTKIQNNSILNSRIFWQNYIFFKFKFKKFVQLLKKSISGYINKQQLKYCSIKNRAQFIVGKIF